MIQRILQDSALHARLREVGLARAATYTWRKTAEAVLQTYQNLE
jgi:hypothetical protein